jgi:hypothetical protein
LLACLTKKKDINQELNRKICVKSTPLDFSIKTWEHTPAQKAGKWGKTWYWLCCSVPKHCVVIMENQLHTKNTNT